MSKSFDKFSHVFMMMTAHERAVKRLNSLYDEGDFFQRTVEGEEAVKYEDSIREQCERERRLHDLCVMWLKENNFRGAKINPMFYPPKNSTIKFEIGEDGLPIEIFDDLDDFGMDDSLDSFDCIEGLDDPELFEL